MNVSRKLRTGALVLAFACLGCRGGDFRVAQEGSENATPSSDVVTAEIEALGSEDFERREVATSRLREMGEAVRDALEHAAATNDDPEVRQRAAALLPRGTIEKSILNGLRWLARHQSADGSWDSDGFLVLCGKRDVHTARCVGAGDRDYDVGCTALALLAFVKAGYTHQSTESFDGVCFGTVVKSGFQWLTSQQDSAGFIGRNGAGKFMYNHVMASLALAEAYGRTKSSLLKENAQKAIDALLVAQNPFKGWRYTIKPGDNDSSVTGWAMLALASSQGAGLTIGNAGLIGGLAWFDTTTGDDFRVGYFALGTGKVIVLGKNEEFEHHETLTAIGIVSRLWAQRRVDDPRVRGGRELLLQDLPSAEKLKIDYCYWYFGSLALRRIESMDGEYSTLWEEAVTGVLLLNQKHVGCEAGSWDAIDRWSFEGGRVYGTAINVLTLEECEKANRSEVKPK